jgi:hypothetical protein
MFFLCSADSITSCVRGELNVSRVLTVFVFVSGVKETKLYGYLAHHAAEQQWMTGSESKLAVCGKDS